MSAPMQLVVFEDGGAPDLLPLTYFRATFELRCGCDTLLDKIFAAYPGAAVSTLVRAELADLVAERLGLPRHDAARGNSETLWINGRRLLTGPLSLAPDSSLWRGDTLVAARLPAARATRLTQDVLADAAKTRAALAGLSVIEETADAGVLVRYPWDLIAANAAELRRQIPAIAAAAPVAPRPGVHLLNEPAIRIGAGVTIKPLVVLDAEEGPIHIAEGAIISPGAVLKGPCSIGARTLVQAGAAIREGASIGPVCKVGGEIEGSIFQGYSNKQHDGFVGHSYLGEWVNLGADTVTSDLKNTYGEVSMPLCGRVTATGQKFLGAVIGDHTKTGICTALTTGTWIGACCNVVSSRPSAYVRSLTWLTPQRAVRYELPKTMAVARAVMARRKVEFTKHLEQLFNRLPQLIQMCESHEN